MRSRLVELRRARWVALGALAVGLGGAFAPALAQDAELGLRGATETLADAASPLAQAAPIQTPDAATSAPAIAPPVDGAADANAKPSRSRPRSIATKLPPLKPYPGAQRLGLRGGPADPQAKTPAPTVAAQPMPQRRKAAADDKPFDPIGVRVGDLKLTPYVEEDGGWASNPDQIAGPHRGSALRDDRSGRRAAIRLVAQRSARPVEGRLHRLFRRFQRQFADRERHARRALRREPRPVVRRRRPL